jgi:D-alanine-D-alanine ligase
MKGKQSPVIGVIYNVFVPVEKRSDEAAAEEATGLCAREVSEALVCAGFQVRLFPIVDNILETIAKIMKEKLSIIINLCEGYCGNSRFESNVAAMLELTGLPFTGNLFRTLLIAQDKYLAKVLMQNFSLPVPEGWLIKKTSNIPQNISFPIILKPNYEDGSIGIREDNFVKNIANLKHKAGELINKYKQPVLAEEYIEGREFNVSIIETRKGLKALPPAEIKFIDWSPSESKIVSYHAKWDTNHSSYRRTVPVAPAELPKKTAALMQSFALKAAQIFNVRGYARVDMRMKEDNSIYILEINPNPDVSREAGFSRALEAAVIPYNKFWQSQIEIARKNYKKL